MASDFLKLLPRTCRFRSSLFLLAASLITIACGGDGGTGIHGGPPTPPLQPKPARIVLAPTGTDTLTPGATQQLTATVYTANDSILTTQYVAYTSSNSSVATVSNNGFVSSSGAIGTTTITASVTSDGQTISASVVLVYYDRSLVNVPKTITLAQPISTALVVGESTPVTVKVTDIYGNVVTGSTVDFIIGLGTGSVSPTSATTDASGTATTSWTVGTILWRGNTIIARAGNAQLSIDCKPLPGPLAAIAMSFPFAGLTVGNGVGVAASARDAYGNPILTPAVQFATRNPSLFGAPSYPSSSQMEMISQAAGQTYIVANVGNITDSTLVAVFQNDGVLVSAAVPRFDLRTDTTFITNVQISTGQSTPPIGSLTLTVTWDPTVLTYVSDSPTYQYFDGSLIVNRDNVANGSITIAVASGTSIGAPIALRILTFTASSTANRHGMLGVTVSEISTNTFVSLLPVTQVVSFPVRTR